MSDASKKTDDHFFWILLLSICLSSNCNKVEKLEKRIQAIERALPAEVSE
jgi:hypothetical protein